MGLSHLEVGVGLRDNIFGDVWTAAALRMKGSNRNGKHRRSSKEQRHKV